MNGWVGSIPTHGLVAYHGKYLKSGMPWKCYGVISRKADIRRSAK
nr:MAG TPA: hypothetical protein [Caudoviricetes sp.]